MINISISDMGIDTELLWREIDDEPQTDRTVNKMNATDSLVECFGSCPNLN